MTEGMALRGQALVVQRGKRRDPDAWLFNRHDHKHEPSWEPQRKEALVQLEDSKEEAAKRQLAERLRFDATYWEISEYSTEEIEAIRESDKLDPELAEYYGDLLEGLTRVFYDANVIFAASDSTKGAARVLVRLAQKNKGITLLATEYTLREARQTIERDSPSAITEFYKVREGLSMCFEPSRGFVETLNGYMPAGVQLPKKDLPVMGGAIVAAADWLVTHDNEHFGPLYGKKVCGVEILHPGTALERLK